MIGLILLAIAAVLIAAVTHDLIRTNRSDMIGIQIVEEEKQRRRRAERHIR
jgi:hypothetical protein